MQFIKNKIIYRGCTPATVFQLPSQHSWHFLGTEEEAGESIGRNIDWPAFYFEETSYSY